MRSADGRFQRQGPNVPLFIVCQNPRCCAVKQIPKLSLQRRQQFCSRRCAGTISPVARQSPAVRRALAKKANDTRRSQWIVKLAGLTPGEIYRLAYSVGWKAGVRRERRRKGAAV
jgi:hypothetical protein